MEKIEVDSTRTGLEIAVIGMYGRFPGAGNIDEFWENLKNGVESLSFCNDNELENAGVDPALLQDPNYVKARGGVLEGIEYFDAAFFDYVPGEAAVMPPQVRIFHECAWEALENAGYNPDSYPGSIGLYAGASWGFDWEALTVLSGKAEDLGPFAALNLSNKDFLGTRVSYKLNLTGPSIIMQTACSTSLVVIELACRGILTGQCNLALAGGVAVSGLKKTGYLFQEGMILSPDGHCRPFDARAKGTIGGEGIGIVVLKLLAEAEAEGDFIHAVIKGSAINNDGNRKVGYTAPSIEGQAEVIRDAHNMAEIQPESITYVETHGTGTSLGDPVEIEALVQGFDTRRTGFCAINSVKANIGHLDAAAGVTGFIKTVLALKHRQIPPALHFESTNPKIDLENTPFYVNRKLKEWKRETFPLRAGISSFGIGGTNAHIVLEEAPQSVAIPSPSTLKKDETTLENPYQLILLSAKTMTALDKKTENLLDYFKKNPGINLADAAYTLQVGRKAFKYRRMLVCSQVDQAIATLETRNPREVYTSSLEMEKKTVIFMFSGLGSQYVNMGKELYQNEPVFRKEMDLCFELLENLVEVDIKEILYPGISVGKEAGNREIEQEKWQDRQTGSDTHPSLSAIHHFEVAQLAMFIFEYALARLVMKWGIMPDAVIGYSFGEYTAACIAGIYSLEEALKLLVIRGQLIKKIPPGAMLSVPMPEKELTPMLELHPGLSLAIDNGPSCIVAGPNKAIDKFEKQLKEKHLLCMRLKTSQAIHSGMMDPILNEYEEKIRLFTFHKPGIPYISNVTGDWLRYDQAVDPGYWVTHLRETVRFSRGIRRLQNEPGSIFIEIGPGRDLTAMVSRSPDHPGYAPEHDTEYDPAQSYSHIVNLVKPQGKEISGHYYLLNKIGRLWLLGITIDWSAFYNEEKRFRNRIPLPVYPFERQYFPVDENALLKRRSMMQTGWQFIGKSEQEDRFYLPSWKRAGLHWPGDNNGLHGQVYKWLVFVDRNGIGTIIVKRLKQEGHDVITVTAGTEFTHPHQGEYTVNPGEFDDYQRLYDVLGTEKTIPHRIIHLWSLTGNTKSVRKEPWKDRFEKAWDLGCFSLINIAGAISKLESTQQFRLIVVSDYLQDVSGEELISPEKATLLGPLKVIPQEHPNIRCTSIDVVCPPSGSPVQNLLIKQLLAEITREQNSTGTVVAFRGRHRWEQTFEPLLLDDSPTRKLLLREKGVYLITGGLGEIGLVLAEYLAKEFNARLVLTSRSPLPPRQEWEQENTRFRKVLELEKSGTEVLVFAADIADLQEMQAVIAKTEERFGPINGIIHAAGLVKGSSFKLVRNLKNTDAQRQFQAKVHGTMVLEKLFRDRKPDFCWLMSSISTILGGLQFAAYAAANTFMDAFVSRVRPDNPTWWLSVNWDGMPPAETINAFKHILSLRDVHQVVVSSTGNLNERIRQWIHLENLKHENISSGQPESSHHPRPLILTPYVSPCNQRQELIANAWKRIFGFEKIGIRDDFLELGGDSLKAITVISAIHRELDVEIPLQEFFNRSTIEKCAEYIEDTKKSIYTVIPPVEKKEYYILSPAQKRLYILQHMDKESIAYNGAHAVLLEGNPHRGKLEQTCRDLLDRHESFRTSIRVVNEEPVQVIHRTGDIFFKIEYHEAVNEDQEKMMNRFIRPFNLFSPPFLRVGLVKIGKNRHVLVIDMHHIVTDGVSHQIFVNEFAALYAGEKLTLPQLKLQYKDYVEWQDRPQQQAVPVKQQDYWLERFDREIPVLNLPVDYARPTVQNFAGSMIGFNFDRDETQRLKELAAAEEVTLYMVLLAIYAVFLSKITGQGDIVVGTGTAGRRHPDLQYIVGIFVNTLAIRTNPQSKTIFKEFLQEVKINTLDDFANQEYPFEELVEKVVIKRDTSRNPLFDTMFVLQNIDIQGGQAFEAVSSTDFQITPYNLKRRVSKFDLTLFGEELDGKLHFFFEYSTALLKPGTIDLFITYFKEISASAAANPAKTLREIVKISNKRKQAILEQLNRELEQETKDLIKLQISLQQRLTESFQKFTGRTALEYGSRTVTYSELCRKSFFISHWLTREKGIKKETLIGILLENRIDVITAAIGILYAGCVFVPLDTSYPAVRLETMLRKTGLQLIITNNFRFQSQVNPDAEDIEYIAWHQLFQLFHFSHRSANSSQYPWFKPPPGIEYDPGDNIYIYFTSGTTGSPQAIMGKNKSLFHFILWEINTFKIDENFRFSQLTNPTFDAFLRDVFVPLCAGGVICIPPHQDNDIGVLRESHQLTGWVQKSGINLIHCVPGIFRILKSARVTPGYFKRLKYILLSGEKIEPSDLEDWYAGCGCGEEIQLVNLWGTSETTLAKTCYFIRRQDLRKERIPVGQPIKGARVVVLDKQMEICDQLVFGELYIKTHFRTNGYYNEPGLNKERFTADPFSSENKDRELLHKTGDLGRIMSDGNIDVLGRNDRQVKIRGIRVELEEIERVLSKHPLVMEAAVVKTEISRDNELLCGYITGKVTADESMLSTLQSYLTDVLPGYMVPGKLIRLEIMPRKPSSKIDYDALPHPLTDEIAPVQPPRNRVEVKLLELWADILGIGKEKIGITRSFFEIGGNSLNIMTLISRIHREFDFRMSLGEIFNNPTIEKQAAVIMKAGCPVDPYQSIKPLEKKEYYALSSAQKRLYFLQQMGKSSIGYNMPQQVNLKGKIDGNKLEQVLGKLIRRHESLRTSFQMLGDKPVQKIHEPGEIEFVLEWYELQGRDVQNTNLTISESTMRNFVRPFDLSRTPLIRSGIMVLPGGSQTWMIDLHHIAADGTSHTVLTEDFVSLFYESPLEELRIQYKDFSEWQNRIFASEAIKTRVAYWLELYPGEIPRLQIAADYKRPEIFSFAGANYGFKLEKEDTEAFNALGTRNGATLYMNILAALNTLFYKYTGQTDIIIGNVSAGRQHADLQRIIGMFVNTLAMRNFPGGEKSYEYFLTEVVENCIAAFENQDVQLEELVDKLELARDPGRNPLFDISMVVQNFRDFNRLVREAPIFSHSDFHGIGYGSNTSKFDLTFFIIEQEEEIYINIEYYIGIFKAETIKRLANHFLHIIKAVSKKPGIKLKDLHIITVDEKKQVLYEFNNTARDYPADKTIPQLFEKQARQTPDSTAVIHMNTTGPGNDLHTLTYRELNEQSNQLARVLREIGINSGTIVAIIVDRSIEMVCGLLGILKAGAAYLPVSPDYPVQRKEFMLKDSSSRVLLTVGKYSRQIKWNKVVLIEKEKNGRCDVLPDNLEPVNQPGDLAYVIYTSGTTGYPRGTLIEHLSVVRLVKNTDFIVLEKNDRLLQTGALEFDASTFEIWGSLLNGLTLYLAAKDEILIPARLKEMIRTYGIGMMWLTSPLFNRLAGEDSNIFAGLTYLLVGGDVLSPIHINKVIRRFPTLNIINGYGPTENTTFSTTFPIEKEYKQSIPIGKPIANSYAYIIDKSRELQPIGVPGELCLSGAGISRGYLNNPELTSEKFVRISERLWQLIDSRCSIVLIGYDRFYLSGDLCRWLPDGNIEFLGRIDGHQQVKIRGFRVEVREIESRLLQYEGIKQAIVIAGESAADKYLCAYLVSAEKIDIMGLKEYLSGSLPSYMLPSYFVQIEKIPLTPNGKVNRKALPAPEPVLTSGYTAPRDKTEKILVSIWSDVLGIEKNEIGIDANFFDLGGHSLKATVLTSRIHKEAEVKIPLAEIFITPTIRGLAEYIRKNRTAEDVYMSIKPVEKKDYYFLSPAQKRLYFLQQMSGARSSNSAGTSYNIPLVLTIERNIDIEKLKKTLKQVIARHEGLRTSFHMIEDQPVQKIHEPDGIEFVLEWYELQGRDGQSPNLTIFERTMRKFVRPFDLSRAPLIRSGIIVSPGGRQTWMVDLHHIAADGTSHSVLTEDFLSLFYENNNQLEALRIQYKDYSEWQNRIYERQKIKNQVDYWMKLYPEEIPRLQMAADYKRPEIFTFAGDNYSFRLEKEDAAAFNASGAKNGATLYMNILAALNTLFYKYTGQTDIIIGSVSAGRQHADLQRIIGMFVNTLAMRNYPDGEKSYDFFLKEVVETCIAAFENQGVQFEELVDQLELERDPGRNPLFDVSMVVQNFRDYNRLAQEAPIFSHSDFTGNGYRSSTSKFDLTFFIIEQGEEIYINIEYYTGIFKPGTIKRLAAHFLHIIKAVSKEPGIKLKDLHIITADEKKQVLYEFNNTAREYPVDKTIPQLFEKQARQTPDSTAVIDMNTSGPSNDLHTLTYRELNEQSNQFARKLREIGINSGTIVAIMVDRSIEMVCGLLGIQKVGAAYLPVSPDYPVQRKEFMLEDSSSRVLLTVEQYSQQIKWNKVLLIEKEKNERCEVLPANLEPVNQPDDLAYVIYTSGTTGYPKGTLIEHRSVVRLVKNTDYIVFKKNVRLLQTGALEFDASTFEIWGSLLNGLTLCLAATDEILVPGSLKEMIRTYGIGMMWLTSPLFNRLAGEDSEIFTGLKHLLVGGDVLSPIHINKVKHRLPALNIINGYGPTENTTFSTTFPIEKEYKQSIPIGKPIANSYAYILGKSRELQPIGIPGELCLGGAGISRGYLNNPELTYEKFVKITLQQQRMLHDRFYLSGDLCRWLPDGNIEFLGRIDGHQQVKIRGFRVEVREIENRLLQYEGIKQAIVIAGESAADKYLCAYLVSGEKIDIMGVKEYLSGSLPSYMLPSYFMQIEKIPLTANGKVNHKALPAPEPISDSGYTAPRDKIEEMLVNIWSDVLGIEKNKIGIDANFFDLGGHSLKATVLTSRIHKEAEVKIPLAEIFITPVIRGLAEYIRKNRTAEDAHISLEPVEKKDYYFLSPAQKRLYFLQQIGGANSSTGYNIPLVLSIKGNIDIEKLDKTFKQIIARHESLRTSFEMADEEPVQRIHDKVEFNVVYFAAAEDRNNPQQTTNGFIRWFDLSQAPLLRVGLVKTGEQRHILMIDMHHIITDGTSRAILTKEFTRLYPDPGEELPGLKLHYKDYAQWQKNEAENEMAGNQLSYWLREFAVEIPILNLPVDYTRPAIQDFAGSTLAFQIDENETRRLKKLAATADVTLYMLLMALFNVFLAKISSQEDIVVGTPVAGRTHADIQHIIGMFVNTLAIRNRPAPHKSFVDFLADVRLQTLKAFEHQDYPFEDLVDKLSVRRDAARNPLFDAMFVLQNMENPELEIPGLKIMPAEHKTDISKFDLSLFAIEEENQLFFTFEYCTGLFKQETCRRFTRYFKKILSFLVENPGVTLAEIEIISDEEKKQLLIDFNQTTTPYPVEKTLHQLFAQQAKQNQDNIALQGNAHITYSELDDRSNQLAELLSKKGMKPDAIAAVIMEHSIETIIGILGILKSGGAYLPIDAEYPGDRINYMLSDSNVRIIVTSPKLKVKVKAEVEENAGQPKFLPIIFINIKTALSPVLELPGVTSTSTSALTCRSNYANLAYVIYTSGSTGKPKGVTVDHSSVVNYLKWAESFYLQGERYDLPLYSSLSVDLTVTSAFLPLISGNKIILYPNKTNEEPAVLRILRENRVQVIKLTPTHLNLLKEFEVKNSHIKKMIVGGEELTTATANEISGKFANNIEIYNEYGPTETTVGCTIYKFNPEADKRGSVPIGTPLANTRVYILDSYQQLLPIGVPGELYVSGTGVARGYLNQPELTLEKFCLRRPGALFEKTAPGPRKNFLFYKTGDMARWLPEGIIEFLGRIDEQVKIRGFRIELGEIESQLLKLDYIKEAVTAAKEDENGDKFLCAYIVAAAPEHKETIIDDTAIKAFLTQELPGYMIPAFVVQIESLPLLPNGKVDKKALPDPLDAVKIPANSTEQFTPPQNEIEKALVDIWEQVLPVSQVNVHDNFFEKGGDSIKAIQVSARLKKYGLSLEIKDIFLNQTLRQLSHNVKRIERLIDQNPVEGEVELTPIQHWFFENHVTDCHHYNHALMIYREKGFDANYVKQAFTKIVEHHDALRMVFDKENSRITQQNRGITGRFFDLHVVNDINDMESETGIVQAANRLQEGIDLKKGPLVKLDLFKTSKGDHLLMVIHHLVVDGVSWRILLEDFASAYSQLMKGEEITLQEKTDSFKYWADLLKQYSSGKTLLKELPYWKQIGQTKTGDLPKDFKIGMKDKKHRHCDTIQVNLNETQTRALLEQVNQAYNTRINDILLTALGLTIKEFAGIDRVKVNLEGHGREPVFSSSTVDISRTVGWFTSRFPVLLDMTRSPDLPYLIKHVKETLRRIPENGTGYGILRYLTPPGLKKEITFGKEAEIDFNYLGQFDTKTENGIFEFSGLKTGNNISPELERPHVMDISGIMTGGSLMISFTYNKCEYTKTRVEQLAQLYRSNLEKLIRHCCTKQEKDSTPSDYSVNDLDIEELEEVFTVFEQG